MNDRRISFFLIAAAACFLLIPLSPPEFRWVAEVLGVVYVVLAALVALEVFGGKGKNRDRSG